MGLTLNRRTILRAAGAAVGLPVLECMLNSNGTAYAQSQGPLPKRYAVVFAGQALGGDDWAENEQRVNGNFLSQSGHFIVPSQTGRTYTLTTPLQPLAALKDKFSIVSNLRIPFNANDASPGAVPVGGAFRDFHGGGACPLLCGTRSIEANFTARSRTSDQIIAQLNTGQTTFNSLVYRAQPSWYLSGSSYYGREYISYTGDGQPIDAQTNPQIAYNTLFGNFTPQSGTPEEALQDFTLRTRRSVLDLITAKRQGVLNRVGAADRRRLERHFDEIRALEVRLGALPPPVNGGACQLPTDPGAPPPVGGNNAGSGSDTIGTNTGYSDEDTRAKVFADLIAMAFACDLSRAATLQITVFQSHMNVYTISSNLGLPIRADLHECGHNGDANNRGQLPVSTCLKWHVSLYAYLVDKLNSMNEGAGTVLDNCSLVFMPEAGHGTQLNDGSSPNATHSVERMILLIAGRAGGLMPGQHIDGGTQHPGRALISAMQAAGYTGNTFGEVSGNIGALFT